LDALQLRRLVGMLLEGELQLELGTLTSLFGISKN
jgi:hypothetical protein